MDAVVYHRVLRAVIKSRASDLATCGRIVIDVLVRESIEGHEDYSLDEVKQLLVMAMRAAQLPEVVWRAAVLQPVDTPRISSSADVPLRSEEFQCSLGASQ